MCCTAQLVLLLGRQRRMPPSYWRQSLRPTSSWNPRWRSRMCTQEPTMLLELPLWRGVKMRRQPRSSLHWMTTIAVIIHVWSSNVWLSSCDHPYVSYDLQLHIECICNTCLLWYWLHMKCSKELAREAAKAAVCKMTEQEVLAGAWEVVQDLVCLHEEARCACMKKPSVLAWRSQVCLHEEAIGACMKKPGVLAWRSQLLARGMRCTYSWGLGLGCCNWSSWWGMSRDSI